MKHCIPYPPAAPSGIACPVPKSRRHGFADSLLSLLPSHSPPVPGTVAETAALPLWEELLGPTTLGGPLKKKTALTPCGAASRPDLPFSRDTDKQEGSIQRAPGQEGSEKHHSVQVLALLLTHSNKAASLRHCFFTCKRRCQDLANRFYLHLWLPGDASSHLLL